MPWYDNLIPDYVKKNVLAYLIHRYVGQFIEEKLRSDQLNVDLMKGKGSVENIKLDVGALNKSAEELNFPFEFVDGYIESLHVLLPWTRVLSQSTFVDIHGLKITIQPKPIVHKVSAAIIDLFWNTSMTSSVQLARECTALDETNSFNIAQQPYEGLEIVAQTIESILRRVCVKLFNTEFQIEYVPKNGTNGIGIKFNIDLIEYCDESGKDPLPSEDSDLSNEDSRKAYLIQSFTTKKLVFSGINFSTVEFSAAARKVSQTVISQTQRATEEENLESFISAFEKNTMLDNDIQKNEELESEKQKKEEIVNAPRHVILFGKFTSKQEVRLRMKQEECLAGPKVSVDINFASLFLFLSPRQFHILLELANGLSTPTIIKETSNVTPKSNLISKPMTSSDFQIVEQDLNQQIQLETPSNNVSGFHGGKGWSEADETESDVKFLPMDNAGTDVYGAANSMISGSMESSVTSSLASTATEATQRTKRRTHNVEIDPTAELSHFKIHLASLGIIMLHEDLLIQSVDGNQGLGLSSVQQMQQTVSNFFSQLEFNTVAVHEDKDFEKTKKVFGKACTLNHLRLLAAPVQMEINQKTTLSGFSVTAILTASKLQLHECLYDSQNPDQVIPLLSFTDNVPAQNSSQSRGKPNLRLSIKHIDKLLRNESDITISLGDCSIEFDITIVDRITALIHPPVIFILEKLGHNPWINKPESELQNTISPDLVTNLKILSPLINFRIRFPIPDFRTSMLRTPWWKRNIRSDFLSVILTDVRISTTFRTVQAFQEYCIQSQGLDIIYYETENSVGLPLAKCGLEDKSCTSVQDDSLLQFRLSIKIFPKKAPDLDKTNQPTFDTMATSFYGAFENQTSQQPGPFSAKKVVHESDTPHPKPHKDDADELIIPGDKQEIDEFIKISTASCILQIEIFLPIISLHLQAKHIYELIYNRINNDLLLWEPSAPRPKNDMYESVLHTSFKHFDRNIIAEGPDIFALCKSGVQYESESDTEEGSDDGAGNLFYSAYEHKLKFSMKQSLSTSINPQQSRVVLTITIGHGLVCLNAPARDVTTNNVLPGQQGEFVLNFEDANIFVVSGYQGDEDLGYVCVQVHNAQLYHCEMMPTPSQYPPIKALGSVIGRHLHPTIYGSERGMLVCSKNRGGKREMLTVAIKIQANHETHHVKVVQVALGINKCTLRHKMCNEPNSWISQLLDFFNVHDYPVPGYVAKDVLTEIHLHLWDCAIDYRPLYIPIRSAITVGNFSMSSHLTAQSNSSTLRFIFEECGLFLSEKAPAKNGIASLAPVDLQRDYVNVIEMGLFELSLKTNDKKSGVNPHIDLRASNNVLNIHTCSDSCRMLMQLITYFANDGDLTSSVVEKIDSIHSSPKHEVEQELVSLEPQNISNLSKSQHEHVNNLLGEAMEENEGSEEKDVPIGDTGAQLFFFPDEHQMAELEPLGKPLPQVTVELGDTTYHSNKSSSDTDDEFCIIGNEPGLGMFPKGGLPEIKWLTNDPVRVVDTHFSVPLGKTDLLKPPKHYPTPTMRYTLCDMTLVWHMYGGHDFKVVESENKKKTVNFSDVQLDDVVSFKNVDKTEVKFTRTMERKKAKMPWMLRGGVNRDHNVHMELQLNKVRFQHEQYPDNTPQASRQILIISELEIRDRLECSQINKFLYQYTSQARPKQSHANMVLIKALHIKPDPRLSTQECCLKISLLPLRLNIDQDALLFLITFFNELGGGSSPEEPQFSSSKHNTPTHHPPVMTISEGNEEEIKRQAQKAVNDNLILLMEEKKLAREDEEVSETSTLSGSITDSSPIYFRNVIFSPDVHIRLDYHGKRVDMTHGPLPGLLMGLAQLNCSEIRLKRISYRHGLLGFDKLMAYLLQEWLSDIKKNQLPSLLGGVGPMYSLVQLFQGVRDLFWLPIEQYQKDGRIVRGLQRGANSFTTSTAMAALELTTRLIHLIQITAETAYDMLSPGPSLRRLAKAKGKKKRYHQPQDIREGMTNAYMLVREGIGETADNIVQVAALEKERKGYSGAVGGVLRQIPPTVLKPIIIASEATNNVLGGMRCQLVPDARQEANQKWRNDES